MEKKIRKAVGIKALVALLLLASCTINNNYYVTVPCEDAHAYEVLAGPGNPSARNTTGHTRARPSGNYGQESDAPGSYKIVNVKGYYRKDGTYVKPHTRKIRQRG